MSGNFPFVDISGPIAAGKQYGPGKLGTRANWFVNRSGSAVAQGDVLQADVQNSDSSATTYSPTSTSIFAQALAPRAGFITGDEGGFALVAQGAADDNGEFMGVWHGETDAFVIAASGSMALGTQLVATTAKNFDVVKLTTERRLAMGLETVTTPTTRALGLVAVEYSGFLAPRQGTVSV